jgi:hypothetical protein
MSLVSIGNVLADKELLEAFFMCDLALCSGCCCVEGELGAPLAEAEAELFRNPPEELVRMLPEKNRKYFRRHGGMEVYQGRAYTVTIGKKECVFSCIKDGITFCAVEIAFREGNCPFDKPVSCRLFPIRVRKKFGLDYLVYEKHAMCRHGAEKGREEQVRLVDYVRHALEELYGNEWFMNMKLFVDSSPKKKCQV